MLAFLCCVFLYHCLCVCPPKLLHQDLATHSYWAKAMQKRYKSSSSFLFFSLFFFCDFFLSVFLSCLMIICSSCSQSVSFSFKLSFMRQSLEKDQHWSRNFCFLLCVNPARHSGTLFENDAFGCGFILCFIGLPLSLYCTSTACSFLWVAVARWRSLPFSPKIKMGTAVRLVMMISSRASQRYLFSHTFCHP